MSWCKAEPMKAYKGFAVEVRSTDSGDEVRVFDSHGNEKYFTDSEESAHTFIDTLIREFKVVE